MRTILLASNNRGKVSEIAAILAPVLQQVNAELQLPADVGVLDWDVEETGNTFAENAVLKARALANLSGFVAIADDSGLCVDALGGEPGVRSARWLGERATDADRNEALLERLTSVAGPNRTARFECAAAIAWPHGGEHVEFGTLEGMIAASLAGQNGFGYDPIFCPSRELDTQGMPDARPTLAEMTAEEKNGISHRRKAFEGLSKFFSQIAVGEARNI